MFKILKLLLYYFGFQLGFSVLALVISELVINFILIEKGEASYKHRLRVSLVINSKVKDVERSLTDRPCHKLDIVQGIALLIG